MVMIGWHTSGRYVGSRSIASDCSDLATSIIQSNKIKTHDALRASIKALDPASVHYQFKNSLWNKLLNIRDFEKFDEYEYFRLLELYKDPSGLQKDFLSMNPSSIEQKMALIEAITFKFPPQEISNPSIMEDIANLNAIKLKKIQRLMKKFDLSSKLSREALEDFASEFFLILKGPPISVLDYFAKNKSLKMNERMFRVLQEDLLVRGLKGTLETIPERTNDTQFEKARLYLKTVMKHKAWRLLVIPYDLPWMDRIKISDELLEGILFDGLSAHEGELIVELKKQNLIDHYERFRKVYRPVAFGVGFYFYYQKYRDELSDLEEKNDEEVKKKFLEDFDKLKNVIASGSTVEKTSEDLKEEQFQRVLKSYRERYHEDPTTEEYKELRLKIFGS